MNTAKALIFCGVMWLCWFNIYPMVERYTTPSRVEQEVTEQFNGGHWTDSVNRQIPGSLIFFGLVAITVVLVLRNATVDWKKSLEKTALVFLCLVPLFSSGCYRPFPPVKLEVISNNEEGFLIPYVNEGVAQSSTNSEEHLKNSLVNTQQVKIPQQWVPKGYEYLGANGEWRDAAKLITVDRSPVTREWTADPMSGTSNKNEAVWVMTSDQVEFSTGWTCTARIASKEDAVKFLYNYPTGSIQAVMDREVRALVQTTFGLETTDVLMAKLRTEATPHITSTVKKVTEFFKERGLSITNLGITGGFIYKDIKIQDKLVELFNAEQEKSIADAMAGAAKSKANGLADAVKAEAEGRADAIKSIADAKAYEIEKANKDLPTYLKLKALEIEQERVKKWDGTFPRYFMGNSTPELLLSMPTDVDK